ncbi:glycosyltransferase family 4 protein [Oleidesulfovibrio sp.]|uniref:glycosyltransferase family 4 protein n=1 Tax=Oleidesulfovibrio sp. TaxID=2909707 RepID=UPI003A88725A
MPYESSRWSDLDESQLAAYENCFSGCLTRAVEQFRPHIIHSNHLWVVTALAKRLYPHIPVVASCHGSDLRQFRSIPRIAEHVAGDCRSLDAVLALSGVQKQELTGLYGIDPDRIHVTGAGFNGSLFGSEGPWQANIADGPLRIVYAGKLSRAKGVPWLLSACAGLLNNGQNFVLDICGGGTGAEYDECIRLAALLGDRVRLHGNVAQPKLAELLRAANVFVLPSFFEGLPLVLLEALACGCRLVATRLDGVDEVFSALPQDVVSLVPLPRMQGVDTPVSDDEAVFEMHLADALAVQLRNTAVPTSDEACHKVTTLLSMYSWERVFRRVEQVYKQIADS